MCRPSRSRAASALTCWGVKQEDLQNVWYDLGMPSGFAYARSLRTVKTCVGSEWCRSDTQDSRQMGKDLERALWAMYSPHKVKLAVSGCPRNHAESGIKDVGVIGVDSGWEIYVGGNGGPKAEVAQFFVKVKTAEEVMECAGAFVQLYREEGWYLERNVRDIGRVGLDHVKRKVLEDAVGRKALWARLQFALDGEPDPWFESSRAAIDKRPFIPIVRFRPMRLRSRLRHPAHNPSERGVPAISEWKLICRVDDIPLLDARRVARPAGADVAVFRTSQDQVFALLDRCPHRAYPVVTPTRYR